MGKYFFSLDSLTPKKNSGGSITTVTSDETPGLVNMSFISLKLSKGGSQEPIWHPNANKIGYCTQGKALISIRSPGGVDVFTVKKGDVFFIPQGYAHFISNLDDQETVLQFALNSTKPQVMQLSQAIQSLSDEVFTATFNMPGSFAEGLRKNKSKETIKTLPQKLNNIPGFISSRYKFNIEESSKPVLTKGGYLQLATKTNLPVLDGLGILGFGLNPKGVVEPHWHTNAGELVFIVKGSTKITVLAPDGTVETMNVKAGQGAFAPASHFHNIENVGSEDVEVIAFFNHAEPDYIGVGEVIGAYSNDVLSSIFNVEPSYFNSLKKPAGPLVIVPI